MLKWLLFPLFFEEGFSSVHAACMLIARAMRQNLLPLTYLTVNSEALHNMVE